MDKQMQQQAPKEFIVKADVLNRVFEIINNEVPTGAGTKLIGTLRNGLTPYEAPKLKKPSSPPK